MKNQKSKIKNQKSKIFISKADFGLFGRGIVSRRDVVMSGSR
jgi:hypothetical protein